MFAEYPPDSPDKVGLDDYLLTHSCEDFEREVIEPARKGNRNSATVESISEDVGLGSLTKDSSSAEIEAALTRLRDLLGKLMPVQRQLALEAAKKELARIGIQAPAQLLAATLDEPAAETSEPDSNLWKEIKPWSESVDGADLLDDLECAFTRHVVLPNHGSVLLALWVLFTYLTGIAYFYPILIVVSPLPRCGKTLLLDILAALVSRALLAANLTAPVLFRLMDLHSPCLLIDEADTFLNEDDQLRGVLNAGHRRGGVVYRCVGEAFEPTPFKVEGAKAIASIGDVQQTLRDRGIVLEMKRKLKTETVERWRPDQHPQRLEPLRRKAARWAQDHLKAIRNLDPDLPNQLDDRAQDNWRLLIAIAEAAGGDWPDRARAAAENLSLRRTEDLADAVQLLKDLRGLFAIKAVDKLTTDVILTELVGMDDRSWSEWQGKPITSTQLARLLKPFGIKPKQVWVSSKNKRGYVEEDFEDAFRRYLG